MAARTPFAHLMLYLQRERLDGTLVIEHRFQTRVLGPGSVFTYGPGIPHRIRTSPEGDWTMAGMRPAGPKLSWSGSTMVHRRIRRPRSARKAAVRFR